MGHAEVIPPYVISADVSHLFKSWALGEGHSHPSDQYFIDYTLELQRKIGEATGVRVEVVEEKELSDGLDERIARSPYPVISLDRVYTDGHEHVDGYIDLTRAVDEDLVDLGIAARPDSLPLEGQLKALETDDETPITIVDDVIFSGNSILDIAERLQKINRPVARVIAGVAIGEGLRAVEAQGIQVDYVRYYEEVLDEVCERDFVAGVPLSGRTVLSSDGGGHWSAPYLQPFGHPEKWASIPAEAVGWFSAFCLEQSITLWSETETESGQQIAAHSIPRKLRHLEGAESVVVGLQKHTESTTI